MIELEFHKPWYKYLYEFAAIGINISVYGILSLGTIFSILGVETGNI